MEEEELQTLDQNPIPPNENPPPLSTLPTPPPIAPIPAFRPRIPAPPNPDPEDYEVSDESRLARERHEKAVQDLLLKRRAFAMAVPTNDASVRARLRRLGEPVTLFGEREMERRDRLREIMLRLETEGQLDRLLRAHEEEQQAVVAPAEDEGPQVYPFFTEGSRELRDARVWIAKHSLARAAGRLERARRRRDDPDEDEEAEAVEVVGQARELVLECSEIGDDRPLTGCSFSHDGALLATWYVVCWFSGF